jgi:hypothetical protein
MAPSTNASTLHLEVRRVIAMRVPSASVVPVAFTFAARDFVLHRPGSPVATVNRLTRSTHPATRPLTRLTTSLDPLFGGPTRALLEKAEDEAAA